MPRRAAQRPLLGPTARRATARLPVGRRCAGSSRLHLGAKRELDCPSGRPPAAAFSAAGICFC